MRPREHHAIFIPNTIATHKLAQDLLGCNPPQELKHLKQLKGMLFSELQLKWFLTEEDRHDDRAITQGKIQSLKSMSSGEQKKVLLAHLLAQPMDYLILDNPFDHLDTATQEYLRQQFHQISERLCIIQLISRKSDLLSFATRFYILNKAFLQPYASLTNLYQDWDKIVLPLSKPLPLSPKPYIYEGTHLISLNDVSVSYENTAILKNITWAIKPGEFWELIGKNGSGKTTILSMITGENSKGYGQELYIFGYKKGSGESVWDLKKKIGYFTPAMTDTFRGYHSVEHMVISGLYDSVGLYFKPGDLQKRLAKQWLQLIGMWHLKDYYFHELSTGQQRMVMTIRAMIKHPLLLILDEPTAGLDDQSAAVFIHLVNTIAANSNTAIIFVAHRKEPNLKPDFTYELMLTSNGSTGKVKSSY